MRGNYWGDVIPPLERHMIVSFLGVLHITLSQDLFTNITLPIPSSTRSLIEDEVSQDHGVGDYPET